MGPRVLALAAFQLAALFANAADFANGSFETINHPPIASSTAVEINPGDTWLTGWTVGGPGGHSICVNDGPINGLRAHEGQLWIGFNGGDSAPGGSLSQTFTTVPGHTYFVVFAVGKVGYGHVSLTASAVAKDQTILASKLCLPTSGVWTDFSLEFTATSSSTTLVFKDTSPETIGVDVTLDDVRFVEPG